MIDLRLGRWQECLSDVGEVDCLIVDAPYSARTHAGHDSAPTVAERRNAVNSADRATHDRHDTTGGRAPLGYDGWSAEDVRALVDSWCPRLTGWFVAITDHVLSPEWSAALASHGRYVFAPIPWVAPGSRVRLTGDGPSSWTCWIIVARPSRDLRTGRGLGMSAFRDGTGCSKWGTLPGAYIITTERTDAPITGTKPLALMQALVRDYSRPGDLICDPCAGTGTTLLAARSQGRRSVGAEMSAETYAYARKRLDAGWQPELFV